VDTFLPLLHEVHRWSDRRKVVEVPLFACYTFVHMASTSANRLTVLKTPGVVAFVGNHQGLSPVPDSEIEQVRAVVSQAAPYFYSPFLKQGERVRIRGGALDGVEGILSAHKGTAAVVVSIELIQRSVAVAIEGYDIEPA